MSVTLLTRSGPTVVRGSMRRSGSRCISQRIRGSPDGKGTILRPKHWAAVQCEMLTLTNLCNENSTRQQFMQGRRDSVFGRQVALSLLSDNPLACPSLDIVSVPVPVGLDFIGINPVKALYWTAVINGLLAPLDRKSVV